jgi:hypothetical protein
MASDFAPLLRSIWSDDDWRALTMDAQHVYLMLLSHPDRNSAGVLSLTKRKWQRLAADMVPGRLDAALVELDESGFIVMDDETSEVESPRLRSALGQELVRLPKLAVPDHNERMATEARMAQVRLDELASMMCDAPPDPPGNRAGQDDAHGMAHGMAHPLAHPPVVVAGVVAGVGAGAAHGLESSFYESESLESNARANVITGRFTA